MSAKIVCVSEYEGYMVGTLYEILDWQADNNVPFLLCDYYVLGEQLDVKDLFKEARGK